MRKIYFVALLSLTSIYCFTAATDKPLSVDEAFKLNLRLVSPKKVEAIWDIEKGFQLYKFSIKISTVGNNGTKLGKIVLS